MQDTEFTNWHKSAHSEDSGCVEIAAAADLVAIRDSKHPDGPILRFNRREWGRLHLRHRRRHPHT